MAAGIHARYPEFQPHDLLSDGVLAHYPDVTTKGCFYYGYATYAAVPTGTLLRANWDKSPWVHRFFEGNAVGNAPIGGPLFVIAGEADQTVPIVGRACGGQAALRREAAGDLPQLSRTRPRSDHGEVDPGSARVDPGALRGQAGGVELPERRCLTRVRRPIAPGLRRR